MTEVMERRATPGLVEFRVAGESTSSPGGLGGYAATFNQTSRDLGGWFEEIAPEAFGTGDADGALDLDAHTRVLCRSEHDSRLLLGTTDAGTLRLFVDDTGLRYEVDLPNTGAGRDAAALAERGDYRFSSFAFYTLPDGTEWREDADGRLIRRVTRAILVDVAPVADPAYWGSSVGKRDFDLAEIRATLHSAADQTPTPAPPGESDRAAGITWRDKSKTMDSARRFPIKNRGTSRRKG